MLQFRLISSIHELGWAGRVLSVKSAAQHGLQATGLRALRLKVSPIPRPAPEPGVGPVVSSSRVAQKKSGGHVKNNGGCFSKWCQRSAMMWVSLNGSGGASEHSPVNVGQSMWFRVFRVPNESSIPTPVFGPMALPAHDHATPRPAFLTLRFSHSGTRRGLRLRPRSVVQSPALGCGLLWFEGTR